MQTRLTHVRANVRNLQKAIDWYCSVLKWEYLKEKVEIVEPLFDTPYGTRKFTIRDIDGNELGFAKG